MVGHRRFFFFIVDFFYFIIQKLTEALHKPLDIIIIKYLLAAKSLLQSLNLVPLQFLEQRTDLRMTDTLNKQTNKKSRNI